ncbi:hypothetical protein C8R46DRAFT_1014194 [Mycena filopes]|nr:hypothetical protein C8R46DRAFT_1014194 [Mycena filopes]
MHFFVAIFLPGIRVHALPTDAAVQRRHPLSPFLGVPIPVLTEGIGGGCTHDGACQLGCCAFVTGTCADPILAQQDSSGLGGCGFGDAAPNCDVAAALGQGGLCIAGAVNGSVPEPFIEGAVRNYRNAGIA